MIFTMEPRWSDINAIYVTPANGICDIWDDIYVGNIWLQNSIWHTQTFLWLLTHPLQILWTLSVWDLNTRSMKVWRLCRVNIYAKIRPVTCMLVPLELSDWWSQWSHEKSCFSGHTAHCCPPVCLLTLGAQFTHCNLYGVDQASIQ